MLKIFINLCNFSQLPDMNGQVVATNLSTPNNSNSGFPSEQFNSASLLGEAAFKKENNKCLLTLKFYKE